MKFKMGAGQRRGMLPEQGDTPGRRRGLQNLKRLRPDVYCPICTGGAWAANVRRLPGVAGFMVLG